MNRNERQFSGAATLDHVGCTRTKVVRLLLKTVVATVLFAIVFQLVACSPAADDPAASAASATVAPVAPPDPAQAAARMQECRAKLEAGIPQGLVINASVDNGRPILWVGPASSCPATNRRP